MNNAIPKIIWILWFQGWENAPVVTKRCIDSWRKSNPGWTIHALTSENISDFIDLESILPSLYEKDIPYDALSDIVRISLLHEYGGIWVDSTLLCNKPLDEWIYGPSKHGFFAFSKPGPDRMISSWFLTALENNYIIERWYQETVSYWSSRDECHHYFWFHYLFGGLYDSDAKFKMIWDSIPAISANEPHYFLPYADTLRRQISSEDIKMIKENNVPVFKLTHKYDHSLDSKDCVINYLLYNT